MKWLEEFGKGLINLGNILVGVIAIKSVIDSGNLSIGFLFALSGGVSAYILGILAIERSKSDK